MILLLLNSFKTYPFLFFIIFILNIFLFQFLENLIMFVIIFKERYILLFPIYRTLAWVWACDLLWEFGGFFILLYFLVEFSRFLVLISCFLDLIFRRASVGHEWWFHQAGSLFSISCPYFQLISDRDTFTSYFSWPHYFTLFLLELHIQLCYILH